MNHHSAQKKAEHRGLPTILFSAGLLFSGAALADEFNFVVEPSYNPQRAQEVYRPLLDYLNSATGHTFRLITPRNYHFYWADLRRENEFHFVFDEAHFTDYRIQRSGYRPLVRTLEPTSYALIGLDYDEEEGLGSLMGKSVATMPAPSLGFALIIELYPNPIQQPEIRSAAATWEDTIEILYNEEAFAAMVPSWLQQRYPQLVVIAESESFPGAAVSVKPGVPDDVSQAVAEALLRLHEDPDLYEVLLELNITQFEPANAQEYDGAQTRLRHFYGYQD